jgi:hypothetical protein
MSGPRWYEGRQCARCGKPFGKLRFWSNKPLLVGPAGATIETGSLPEHRIAELLGTHEPVCWGCGLARAFGGRKAPPTES